MSKKFEGLWHLYLIIHEYWQKISAMWQGHKIINSDYLKRFTTAVAVVGQFKGVLGTRIPKSGMVIDHKPRKEKHISQWNYSWGTIVQGMPWFSRTSRTITPRGWTSIRPFSLRHKTWLSTTRNTALKQVRSHLVVKFCNQRLNIPPSA